MLILARNVGEFIEIGDNIKVTIVSVNHGQVRLGIDAPREIRVDRAEVRARINAGKLKEAT
jgi:carbon storage regulator